MSGRSCSIEGGSLTDDEDEADRECIKVKYNRTVSVNSDPDGKENIAVVDENRDKNDSQYAISAISGAPSRENETAGAEKDMCNDGENESNDEKTEGTNNSPCGTHIERADKNAETSQQVCNSADKDQNADIARNAMKVKSTSEECPMDVNTNEVQTVDPTCEYDGLEITEIDRPLPSGEE